MKIMCEIMEKIAVEERAEGRAEGRALTLIALYRKGIIDFITFVSQMDMSEKEALEKLSEADIEN